MMRGVSTWAVAVRTPAPEQVAGSRRLGREEAARGPVVVRAFPLVSWTGRHPLLRRPVIRGVVALAESLSVGLKALGLSLDAQRAEDEPEVSRGEWALTVVLALALAVGLFFVVPVTLTSLVRDRLGSPVLFWLVEGVLRTVIFLAYLALIARQRDLRRLFEYHGAEHKVIACYEAGEPLQPASAARFSRLHPRCGTSFLLVVMIVAVFVFAPLGLPAWYLLVATRVLGVPLVAGLSFEVIKWAGRHRDRRWVRGIMWPGMQLQRLTTREPDSDQLAVAVAALEAVLAVEDPRAAAPDERVGMEVVA